MDELHAVVGQHGVDFERHCQLALLGADLGDVDVDEADWVDLEPLAGGGGFWVGQPGDAVALQAAVQAGSGQAGDRGLQGIQAVGFGDGAQEVGGDPTRGLFVQLHEGELAGTVDGDEQVQVLHGCATTTEAIRRAIQRSEASVSTLARRHGISATTVQKWRKRETTGDARMGPKQISSSVLTVEQEAIIVAFRRHTLLPLDDP